MKINVDRKSGAIAALLLIVLLLSLALVTQRESGGMGHMNHSTDISSEFSSNDIMFAQMMIPHHQQAVEMSNLAIAISKNPKILALAGQIKSAQAPEISQMKSWLKSAGTSLMGAHGMAMEGMLTDEEIATLKISTGRDFDQLFLEGMIAHHQGALTMVSMIEDSENAEAKKLAANIKSSQSAEIELMKKYLKEL